MHLYIFINAYLYLHIHSHSFFYSFIHTHMHCEWFHTDKRCSTNNRTCFHWVVERATASPHQVVALSRWKDFTKSWWISDPVAIVCPRTRHKTRVAHPPTPPTFGALEPWLASMIHRDNVQPIWKLTRGNILECTRPKKQNFLSMHWWCLWQMTSGMSLVRCIGGCICFGTAIPYPLRQIVTIRPLFGDFQFILQSMHTTLDYRSKKWTLHYFREFISQLSTGMDPSQGYVFI